MESGVLRLLVLAALFVLLTADYSALLGTLLAALGVAVPGAAPVAAPAAGAPADARRHADGPEGPLPFTVTSKARLWATIKTWCLPKMICELHATPSKERLTDGERSLLALIRDTSLSATAEVTSRYHFAAHMGQLIAGVDGTGCHNFYPQCPFPGPHVMSMMKRVKIR
ncbi:hypothetical protein R5R35_012145 [Gryllus longicercus]|uniref:Uncharacterized protein n=1 Tax=Gryllus longicercus TaxID=2509291 RepID=A0AAN9VSZ3_9ORTH